MLQLDQEEQELLDSFEKDEWQSVANSTSERQRYQGYARAALKNEKPVRILLSAYDLSVLQKQAADEGVPYQTLISRVLHQYAAGLLAEKEAESVSASHRS